MTRASEQIAARLLPLCLVIACQGETTSPTAVRASLGEVAAAVTDNVVASVRVIPDSQMVFVGDQFQVTGQPRNKAGQVLDRSIVWKVSNVSVVTTVGSVGPTMTFKALKAGKTSAKATVDAKSRFSKVVVRGVTGAKVVVTPADATVASGATVQFVAKGVTKAGESAAVNVTWTASTGAISSSGVLTAGATPGTYRVIGTSAFGAADTSIVTVTAGPDPVAAVILVPATASVTAGETVQFEAYGRTSAGDSVPVTASYTATGGTIAGNGLYAPGGAAGTFRVIATTAGIADTSEVTVASAPIARVTLLPDIAASRPGESTKFVATVWNTAGGSVPEPVTYETTCGTISGAGVFTAPPNGSGSCFVTASADGKAATTEVVPLDPDRGVPFGISDLWTSGTTTRTSGVAAFSSSNDYVAPDALVSHLATARAKGIHVVLAMTGGSHERYKTAGVFDLAKWQAAMDGFNTPAIRDAVAEGVADGTIIGNSVMDEPQQHGNSDDPRKTWGPSGTMTKVRVDGLCGYVKAIFPTLPVGVIHDHAAFEPNNSYRVCEYLVAQYASRKGNVVAWRDAGLALAARDGMAIIFSLNLLNGGIQSTWPCPVPQTGGNGTYSPNCRMTPEQIRDWGKVLGRAGCALLSWRYDAAFLAKPENQSAISDVAITLSGLPRTRCTTR